MGSPEQSMPRAAKKIAVHFDPDFDSGVAPSLTTESGACEGTVWVGAKGLLTLLETHLGLTRPETPALIQALELEERVVRTPGFWSASATQPMIGATNVLRDPEAHRPSQKVLERTFSCPYAGMIVLALSGVTNRGMVQLHHICGAPRPIMFLVRCIPRPVAAYD